MNKALLIILIQVIAIFVMITIVTFLIMLNNAIKLEKRITKYSIKNSRKVTNISIFDNWWNRYIIFVRKQRIKMGKLFPSMIKRYDKYVTDGETKAVDYVTHKLVIAVLFDLLVIVALAIEGSLVSLAELVLSTIFGFYILDIILMIVNIFKKKKIENQIHQAIIVMNNAFKSGKSTIQAVEIASIKLPKPINMEFKRILQELQYGLSTDIVFDRFAKRVNIPEAEYLSSSLTILNKTGGNIIKVFNSIERTMFDKKKLREELKNSTTVSNLVVKILLVVPILIVLIIYMLDPSYFDPFFSSPAGYVLLGIALFMFIMYAYLLEKIVKVEY